MIHRFRNGVPTPVQDLADGTEAKALTTACTAVPQQIAGALSIGDFRCAATALLSIVTEANRYIEATAPWTKAAAERAGDTAAGGQLDTVLGHLREACLVLAEQLAPFLPDAAARIAAQCTTVDGRLPSPAKVF